MLDDLPVPPLELRELVGPTDPGVFDNPTGAPIFDGLPERAWRSYLDFGCGCGRSARRLAQQHPRPERYLGIDLHAGMIRWCQDHLRVPGFRFEHQDVFNAGFNPDRTKPWVAALPVEDNSVSLIEATSVFTHLVEGQAEFYLDEIARVLTDDGLLQATFFLFDKAGFPFMQDNQNALYINHADPTNAVVFDWAFVRAAMAERGLVLVAANAPEMRGYHWRLRFARVGAGLAEVELPHDSAPIGRLPPPLVRPDAHRLDGGTTPLPVRVTERAEVPVPDPVAVELAEAKKYIASLEEHVSGARGDH
jgi:SAM-dependent methyltransferase